MRISRFPCRYLNTKLENFEKSWVSWKLSQSRLDGDKGNPLKEISNSKYCYKKIDTLELSLSLSLSPDGRIKELFKQGFRKKPEVFLTLRYHQTLNYKYCICMYLPMCFRSHKVLYYWQTALFLGALAWTATFRGAADASWDDRGMDSQYIT